MESPPRELDEARVDAAIADILKQEAAERPPAPPPVRPEFPVLRTQEDVAQLKPEDGGLSAALRQKWAELSGAA